MTYAEAIQFLYGLRLFGAHFGLDNPRRLAALAGGYDRHPENFLDALLTHELGHSMGLNDEYDTTYVDNTMFGYGSMTETKKDTLTTGDIIGVKSLY